MQSNLTTQSDAEAIGNRTRPSFRFRTWHLRLLAMLLTIEFAATPLLLEQTDTTKMSRDQGRRQTSRSCTSPSRTQSPLAPREAQRRHVTLPSRSDRSLHQQSGRTRVAGQVRLHCFPHNSAEFSRQRNLTSI